MTTIHIPGHPRPQGSRRHIGGGRTIESSRHLPAWRHTITTHTRQTWAGPPLTGPIHLDIEFVMPRPKAWGRRRQDPMIQRPDIDKLCRAVLDGITGIILADDSQVTTLTARKRRARPNETPGVHLTPRKDTP